MDNACLPDESQKRVVLAKFDIYGCITVTWSIPLLGGPLVSEGITRTIVSVSAQTWFIRYNYY